MGTPWYTWFLVFIDGSNSSGDNELDDDDEEEEEEEEEEKEDDAIASVVCFLRLTPLKFSTGLENIDTDVKGVRFTCRSANNTKVLPTALPTSVYTRNL